MGRKNWGQALVRTALLGVGVLGLAGVAAGRAEAQALPEISASFPSQGTVGVDYSATFSCNFTQGYGDECSIAGLPDGLTYRCTYSVTALGQWVNVDCSVYGQPTTTGTASLTLTSRWTDFDTALPGSATEVATIEILPAPAMAIDVSGFSSPLTVTRGDPINASYSCIATGAVEAASCDVDGLPGDLAASCVSFDGTRIDCTISGSSELPGTYSLTFTASAANAGADTAGGELIVEPYPADFGVTDVSFPLTAVYGQPYSASYRCVEREGAFASTNPTCSSSELPDGLSESCSGTTDFLCTVSGTPRVYGVVSLTVDAGSGNDSNIANNSAPVEFAIAPDMKVDETISGFPSGMTRGDRFDGPSFTCSGVGDNPTCGVSGMPTGIEVDCSGYNQETKTITCTFSGAPESPGTYYPIFTAGTNGDGDSRNDSVTRKFVVDPAPVDMGVSFDGQGLSATAGETYAGLQFSCRNVGDIAATSPTCAVVGDLPDGLTVSCSAAPADGLQSGQEIACSISGTPLKGGNFPLAFRAGATADSYAGNNEIQATLVVNVVNAFMQPDIRDTLASARVGKPYSSTVKCTNNGQGVAINPTCVITEGTGLVIETECDKPTLLAAGASMTCSLAFTPRTADTITIRTTAGSDFDSLSDGSPSDLQITVARQQPDLEVDLSDMPKTGEVGDTYSGQFVCRNIGDGIATDPICTAGGIGPYIGSLSVGTCVNSAGDGDFVPGSTITCPVTGTVSQSGGMTIATFTLDDSDQNNNVAEFNLTVEGGPKPDMVVQNVSLPLSAEVGTEISGSFQCKNAGTATATNANCAISGLPEGLIATCNGDVPRDLEAEFSIYCFISGELEKVGTTAVSIVASAENVPADDDDEFKADFVVLPGPAPDMAASLSFDRNHGMIGTVFSGSAECRNIGNLPAADASCRVTGLPSGVTVTSCTRGGDGATLQEGGTLSIYMSDYITCTFSGYPDAAAGYDIVVATGATDDSDSSNDRQSQRVTIYPAGSGVDLVLDVSTIVTTGEAGVEYSSTFSCRNDGVITASSAQCEPDDDLPPGLDVTKCEITLPGQSPMPWDDDDGEIPGGATVTCTIAGTPVSGGSTTIIFEASSDDDTDQAEVTFSFEGPVVKLVDLVTAASEDEFPRTGQVNVPFKGIFSCANKGVQRAYDVYCDVNEFGPPDGLRVTSCTVGDDEFDPGDSLAAGATVSCSYEGTPREAGEFSITIAASSDDEGDGEGGDGTYHSTKLSLVIDDATPELTVTATASPTTFSGAGDVITFSFTVTNSGKVGVKDIALTSNQVPSIVCPVTTLAIGADTVCTGAYTTTAADVLAGSITIDAELTATPDSGADPDLTLARASSAAIAITVAVSVTVILDTAAVIAATEEANREHLERSAKVLMSASPSTGRLHGRLGGGTGGSGGGGAPFLFSGSGDETSGDVYFATSFSQVLASAAAFEAGDSGGLPDDAMGLGGFSRKAQSAQPIVDFWLEGSASYFNADGEDGEDRGHSTVFMAGADAIVAPGLLVGVMAQADRINHRSADGRDAEARGWMAGPYMSAQLSANLYLDTRLLFGSADNEVDPVGAFTDQYESDRMLASAKLSGDWKFGAWNVRPSAELLYFTERQQAYTNSIGLSIRSQTLEAGRFVFGPEVGYRHQSESGAIFEPYFGIKGVWDFAQSELATAGEPIDGDWSARVEAGASLRSEGGLLLDGSFAFDGLGSDTTEVWRGNLRVTVPLN